MDVRKFSVPEIIYGRGSLKYAALCAKRLGAERVFLVSDPGLENVGWVEQIFDILRQENLSWTYFNDVVANPRDHQVEKGAELYT
ncbi:MAG: iron-containing alcohol dehydrogenase, partial [Desulfobacteraceae bacterium]